jgi:DNA-binding XRE family transcriptional regulator
MAGVKQMSDSDMMRTINAVTARPASVLGLTWSDGTEADINISAMLGMRALRPLRENALFAQAGVGDWGHSVVWPGEIEIGADILWQEVLSATVRSDTRQFLEWRMRHGLSLGKAADALGVSRRTIAYYSNGEKKVPRPILLACRGWEVEHAQAA